MSVSEIISKTYYGNTVSEWFISLVIIFGIVILAKFIYWVSKNILKKITARSKTQLDDILVDMIEEPLVFAVAVFGIWLGLKRLLLSDIAMTWVGNGFQILITITIAWFLSRLFEALYRHYLIPLSQKTASDLDDEIFPIVRKSIKLIIWILAIVIALNNAGYDVGAVLAGLGIGGLALAMAAKDTVGNIFGGFTIFADKPFKLKDRVKVCGYDGFVMEIGLRSTRIRTLEGRVVTIPNSKFTDNPVENVSKEPSRKVKLNLGLTYDTTPAKMKKAIKLAHEIILTNEDTNDNAIVSFNEFGDFAMNLQVIYYIKRGKDVMIVPSDINLEFLTVFNKNKLEFAFPTQTIYTKKG